jgi:phage shock protein A
MDAQSQAFINAVVAGNTQLADQLLDEMFSDYGKRLELHGAELDEAATAVQGLFDAAEALAAE